MTEPTTPETFPFDTEGMTPAQILESLLTLTEDAIDFGDFDGDDFTDGARTYLMLITRRLPVTLWQRNPRIYRAKLLIKHRVKSLSALAGTNEEYADDPDFQRMLEYAKESNPALLEELRGILTDSLARTEWAELTFRYELTPCEGGYSLVACRFPHEGECLSITHPDIVEIGEKAFYQNKYIRTVTIGGGVKRIGDCAFADCKSLTSVRMEQGVSTLGNGVFIGCTALTELSLADSITHLGGSAFCNCTALVSVTLPQSISQIPYSLFQNCNRLTAIDIPNGVSLIDTQAFCNCASLVSVTIPNTVLRIHYEAFMNCHALATLSIPQSVSFIETDAFRQTFGLRTLYLSRALAGNAADYGVITTVCRVIPI